MGLFGKHDDGYVSPFDVDDAPAYVDFSSADGVSDDTHDATHATDAASRHGSVDASTSARRDRAQQAASVSPNQQTSDHQTPYQQTPAEPSRRERQRTQRQSNVAQQAVQRNRQAVKQASRNRTTGHGGTRQTSASSKRNGKGVWIVALIVVIIFSTKLPQLVIGSLFGGGSDSDSSSFSSSAWNGPSHDDKPTKEKTGRVATYDGDSAEVTIAKAAAGPNDIAGQPTVIVTYHWRNTGEKTTTFSSFVMDRNVFQHGEGLIPTTLYNTKDSPIAGYDPRSTDTKVRAGEELDTTIAYRLIDKTTDLFVEANEADSLSEGIVSAFAISNDGTTFTQIDSTPLRKAPQASAEERKPLKPIHSYSADVLASITNVTRGPNDYNDNPTIIVTIDWVNTSEASEQLTSAADLTVTQNGRELDANYYMAPWPDGYEELSDTRRAQPGALARSTVSYKLDDANAPVKVTLKSRYGGHDTVTRTIKLPKE
ncbi:DUF5067 domain-containing protein [Bifidobacterium leontopitheci]|uniref:DUF5067 domain-containing protein n=1 Tax=Bifidobacterium leontopitheci TaxID=2650774 RepID=A0A6I1GFQ3_9BIFI|nr:DUF5067 domain-containing protein [Bifidobacterium leontopitheci]KAB7790470.1 hypothetical protein F7D09_0966 [Bifidobacterium leontopitheci]